MTLVIAGVIAFAGSLLAALFLRRKTTPILSEPISAYITGPYGALVTAGFLALAAALGLLAETVPGPVSWRIPLLIAIPALLGVVGTKWYQLRLSSDPVLYSDVEKLHLACAGVAFGAVTFAEIHAPLGTAVLPWIAVALATAFTLLKQTNTTLLEWTYAGLIIAWFAGLLK